MEIKLQKVQGLQAETPRTRKRTRCYSCQHDRVDGKPCAPRKCLCACHRRGVEHVERILEQFRTSKVRTGPRPTSFGVFGPPST